MHPDMAFRAVKDRQLELNKAAEHHRLLSLVSGRPTLLQRAAQRARSWRYRALAGPARLGVRPGPSAARTS
jgi:hypothetical protein